ncbi:MAG: sulfatase-like hydrolase/transferase [Fuerstiella sp.]|nr:sulfatase-like hydrolase/transferase [Fuerstiella sp.]
MRTMTETFRSARKIVGSCIVAICATSGLMSSLVHADSRPNILFILLDNVGKDWFRCYGSQENQTPNIDRLARTGLKVRNCYVTPVCSTTRTMLLTGRYPFTTGWHTHHDPAIYGGGYFDWKREVCMARVMRDAGYDTCISGKWQINDLFDPEQKDALNSHGFDDYCIFPEGRKGHPAHKQRYWDPYVVRNGELLDTAGQFGPDIFADHLVEFFRRPRNKPFFAYYSTILTHIPVVHTPHNRGQQLSSRELFAGMLNYADHLVARLQQGLVDSGMRDNTLIFIVVDNGTDNGTDQNAFQSLGGRIGGRISGEGIYSLTERGINMPLIVNCPKLVPGSRESDWLVDATDFLPTLAEFAGGPLPAGVQVDGQSFAAEILGKESDVPPRGWCLTQYYKTRAVRDQRFKLYSSGEFYDLSEDPLEQHSISAARRRDESSFSKLSAVLSGLPENATLPWEFRSISARKIRSEEAAALKATKQ